MNLFPSVRLSELRGQLQRDRATFEQTVDNLQHSIHEKTRPFKFLLNHPGLLIGSVASLFALYEVGSSVLTPAPLKAVNGSAKKAVGIFGRLTRLGLGVAIKAATPTVTALIKKAWLYAASSKDRKGHNSGS